MRAVLQHACCVLLPSSRATVNTLQQCAGRHDQCDYCCPACLAAGPTSVGANATRRCTHRCDALTCAMWSQVRCRHLPATHLLLYSDPPCRSTSSRGLTAGSTSSSRWPSLLLTASHAMAALPDFWCTACTVEQGSSAHLATLCCLHGR
jgi:hypothetical protein